MRLKALKVEIEHLQLLMDKAKVKLQKEFEVWWAEEATSLQVCCGKHRDSVLVLYKLGSLGRQWGGKWLSNLRPVGTGHGSQSKCSQVIGIQGDQCLCSRASGSLTNER